MIGIAFKRKNNWEKPKIMLLKKDRDLNKNSVTAHVKDCEK